MSLDEIDQLIRLAQVLKSRTNLLSLDLVRIKRDHEAERARDAMLAANKAASILISIANSINRPDIDA